MATSQEKALDTWITRKSIKGSKMGHQNSKKTFASGLGASIDKAHKEAEMFSKLANK